MLTSRRLPAGPFASPWPPDPDPVPWTMQPPPVVSPRRLLSVVPIYQLGAPEFGPAGPSGLFSCEGVGFLGFLKGTRSTISHPPNDLAKSVSDGDGPHQHPPFPLHEHGEPKFTDEEVAYLEGHGLHVDRHHGTVFSYNGSLVSPSVLTSMLSAARQEGTLNGDLGPMAALLMKASGNPVSGLSPGEVVRTEQASLAVQYLDLRG